MRRGIGHGDMRQGIGHLTGDMGLDMGTSYFTHIRQGTWDMGLDIRQVTYSYSYS